MACAARAAARDSSVMASSWIGMRSSIFDCEAGRQGRQWVSALQRSFRGQPRNLAASKWTLDPSADLGMTGIAVWRWYVWRIQHQQARGANFARRGEPRPAARAAAKGGARGDARPAGDRRAA